MEVNRLQPASFDDLPSPLSKRGGGGHRQLERGLLSDGGCINRRDLAQFLSCTLPFVWTIFGRSLQEAAEPAAVSFLKEHRCR